MWGATHKGETGFFFFFWLWSRAGLLSLGCRPFRAVATDPLLPLVGQAAEELEPPFATKLALQGAYLPQNLHLGRVTTLPFQ
uniref:Putative secreted protein n=1 Tax=Ixodes ricinus TaxID=34613 RepID=A0A6B0UE04_IXORI